MSCVRVCRACFHRPGGPAELCTLAHARTRYALTSGEEAALARITVPDQTAVGLAPAGQPCTLVIRKAAAERVTRRTVQRRRSASPPPRSAARLQAQNPTPLAASSSRAGQRCGLRLWMAQGDRFLGIALQGRRFCPSSPSCPR